MKLTDYYKMAKLPGQKSKLRRDCIASTGGYEPFEAIADKPSRDQPKRFKFYLGSVPDTFNARAQRKADNSITNGNNLSSIYTPDLDNPTMGYGDMVGTTDALLFLFDEDYNTVEVFVARGLKNHVKGLFALFADGELLAEMEELRAKATPTGVM